MCTNITFAGYCRCFVVFWATALLLSCLLFSQHMHRFIFSPLLLAFSAIFSSKWCPWIFIYMFIIFIDIFSVDLYITELLTSTVFNGNTKSFSIRTRSSWPLNWKTTHSSTVFHSRITSGFIISSSFQFCLSNLCYVY